ncbi:MAG: hypothetical protein VX660_01780 [Candidatus Thermoplasmatota archaeon]|nr:hypothetical protein [Candidatus Thermoplasmatota archaeon]MEC7410671.1 hypothetical protein [Candidatus Thermoplasmatota archaeon]MEC9146448.1 hypothetical protein [Candidatus Thermoplasmatota archaeon]MEC9200367.1 hypothetical protein [Candidatus Thermoplasmatota archaeon]MEE2626055.1 hypothetical protein [Candidatus Thermoplasmatota archaeon]
MDSKSPLTVLIVIMLLSMSATVVSADVDISLSANPSSAEASPDEAAEYTILVRNTGDDDAAVSLSTQQGNDCNGFTSTLETTFVQVGSQSSEQVTLTVTVTDQASGECETTVNAQGQVSGGAPGTPSNADVTVVTTAGDGGGLYSVSLSTDESTTKNYDGEDNEVTWDVDVENNGEQQANVQLEMTSDSDCESDELSATVDPSVLQLEPEDQQEVTVTIDMPNGAETDAGSHCFILKATVTNDPNAADQAEDNLTLSLNVPEIKECDASLQYSSHNLDPGEQASNSIEVENIGNTEWTVTANAQSLDGEDISGWVEFDSPRSKLLTEPGSSDDAHTFTFDVTPDDSLEAGTQVAIGIQGRAGSDIGCEKILTVTVGQEFGASMALSRSTLSNVEPGTSGTLSIQITNEGNGQETMALGTSGVPPGWQVSFSKSSVTLGSSQSSNNKETVGVDVFVPEDASAESDAVISFTIGRGGGSTPYDSKDLTISVAPRHEVSTSMVSDQQTGRSDQIVKFPLVITNEGNIRDTFRLQACDPGDQTGCGSPMWQSSFSDSDGNSITQLALDPGQSTQVYLDVLVEGEEDADSARVLARVAIFGTSESSEHTVTVVVSNYNYGMAVSPQSPGEDPSQMDVVLPPGGTLSTYFWIDNTGDYPAGDTAVITITGLESSVSRSIFVEGVKIDNSIQIPRDGRILIEVQMEVMEGVSNGVSGIIKVSAASERNAAQITSVDVMIQVMTIHDIIFTLEGEDEQTVNYPEKAIFSLFVTNNGNIIEDIEIISGESLRGWTIDIIEDEFELSPGETREIQVRATPPSQLLDDDSYRFTVIAQPEGIPVAGQPVELTVNSVTSDSFLNLSKEMQDILVYGLTAFGALLVIVLFMRSRAENKRIAQALERDES